MTLEYLIGQLAGGVCDAGILGQMPIFNVLAQDQAIELGKKLVRYFHDSDYYIQKKAQEIMSHESTRSRDWVVCAAKECFGMIDAENILMETHYNSWRLSGEKAETYLRAQKHLDDKEKQLLKTYLPTLVESAVHQLQLHLIEDPEFVNQAIGTHHESIADLRDRVKTVEASRIFPVVPTDLVADISAELKNRWNDYPFLERDRENEKKELWEFYKLPFGKFRETGKPDANIHEVLQKTIDSGNDHHKRMLVLMGAPGSGKTTVISYLLNKLKLDRTVRVYSLSDFPILASMNASNWAGTLLTRVGLAQEDLSNSILILDGLDELDLHGKYDEFVETLRADWANNIYITNFTLILTCRTTRLDPNALRCSHVILAPLSIQQIYEFATDYLGECPPKLKDCLEEKEDLCDVLGIPILLYMVLGLGLTVDSDTSIASLYDEIFSLDGDNSIYRRRYNQKKHPLTAALAEKIHLFSQVVAVEMFAEDKVQEELKKTAYIPLAQKIIGDHSAYKPEDLLIGQYFLLGHKEGKIYFVHRSIFEYFVALSIFNALAELAETDQTPELLYKEMVPVKSCSLTPLVPPLSLRKSCSLTPLATLLSLHHLANFPEIKDFLHHLIRANREALSIFSDWAELAKLIFKYGLADAVPDRLHGGDHGLREEAYRFLNLLDICRCILLNTPSEPVDLIPQTYHKGRTSSYLGLLHRVTFADLSNLNLSGAYLPRAELFRADLSGANLSGADLSGADLSEADLGQTKLSFAKLSGADLSEACLIRASLFDAKLTMAILPDGRNYEAALEQDGTDVLLQFTDPWCWNELHPDRPVDPNRFLR